MKKRLCRWLGSFLALSLLSGMCFSPDVTAREAPAPAEQAKTAAVRPDGYSAYLSAHAGAARPALSLKIEGESVLETDDSLIVKSDDYSAGQALISKEGESCAWTFSVAEAGLYQVNITYSSHSQNGDHAVRTLMVNGEVPYFEANSLTFFRYFVDSTKGGEFEQDYYGNDMVPSTQQEEHLLTSPLWDSTGYQNQPLYMYLPQGENTLSLFGQKEDLVIDYLEIVTAAQNRTYEDYLKDYGYTGEEAAGVFLPVEAEHPAAKSSAFLAPQFDRSSAITSPQGIEQVRLNIIGGDNWKTVGQWITWQIDVPESGFYRIGARFRQDVLDGAFVSRRLYIDDAVPFEDAACLRFSYGSDWQVANFGSNEGDYLFYLEKGIREIRLEVTLGDLAPIVCQVQECLASINTIYRAILNITGTSPDLYRDYDFDQLLPDELAEMKRVADVLRTQAGALVDMVGENGEQTATLYRLIDQLEEMAGEPRKIASNFTSFRDNLGALGDWIFNIGSQPLELDYLYIAGQDAVLPKAEAGFFQSLWYNIRLIIASFMVDYNHIGAQTAESEEDLVVWIASGRDQAQIVRTLADNLFRQEYHAGVQVELVAANALMPAMLSGKGPDVALSNAESVPVNFALRRAVLDLTQFDDYDEVASRFYESALRPFTYHDAVYALPETQSFPMLFYRTDIFEQYGLTVPETWDDFYSLIPSIKKRNMDIGVIGGFNGFLTFLFQNEQALYNDLGTEVMFQTNEAIASFEELCNLFTMYKLPITYDFANRFRTGEIPLALADYTMYNQLTVFAPEIAGLWKMSPIPGTEKNGKVRNAAVSTATGVIINRSAKNPDLAWNFLKWWTSADIQAQYGNRLESVLGAAGKQPTANKEALSRLSWSYEDYQNLKKQMEMTQGVPMVPGSYIVSREVEFAFTTVYNNGDDPTQVLEDKIPIINRELLRKYNEFPNS